jgi:hypothetical protein
MPPRKSQDKTEKIDFTRNLIFYYAAIGVIILGYIFLAIGGANSFTSLTLGPIILVAGYVIAMPLALLTGFGNKKDIPEEKESPPLSQAKTKQKS